MTGSHGEQHHTYLIIEEANPKDVIAFESIKTLCISDKAMELVTDANNAGVQDCTKADNRRKDLCHAQKCLISAKD